MRKITSMDRWHLAVYWLSAAFLITVSAWISYAYCVHHEKHLQEERAALLFASDLAALRDSRASDDGNEPVYLALLESRIPHLKGRWDTERLASALKTELASVLAEETETAVREGRFSASYLHQLLTSHLPPEEAQSGEKRPEEDRLRSFGETDAVSASQNLLGLRFLRKASCEESRIAYCRNACTAFDDRGSVLRAYAVYSSVGESVLRDDQCLGKAVRFTRQQGLRVREVVGSQNEDGIRCILLDCGSETALIGVRRDSGSICFFLRSLKKNGNVLQ